jgi:NADPH-dependent glutamate synthase beta subunit-like oxidoreductase
MEGVEFLRNAALEEEVTLGERVIVIGGGNVAIDVALSAKRLGAKTYPWSVLKNAMKCPPGTMKSKKPWKKGSPSSTAWAPRSSCKRGKGFRRGV